MTTIKPSEHRRLLAVEAVARAMVHELELGRQPDELVHDMNLALRGRAPHVWEEVVRLEQRAHIPTPPPGAEKTLAATGGML